MPAFLHRRFRLVTFAVIAAAAPFPAEAADRKTPPPVVVAEVKESRFVDRIEALGTLRANESVDVKANVAETVTQIAFNDGQRVSRGDILVKLLAIEEEALIVEAQSTANEAKQQFERAQQLARTGSSSVASLDEARRVYETARARLGAIESRLTDLRIVAPFDGVVGLRNISIGALLQPGDLITTLDDDSVMKLDFSVPSTFLPVLRPGIPITAEARAFGDEPFKGEITSVSSRVDPVTRSVTVRAQIPNPGRKLLPGLLMTVEVLSNERDSLAIPEDALMPEGTKNSVYVLDESLSPPVIRRRDVIIGTRRSGEVEISEGLTAGEKVVTRGDMTLTDGAPVSIMAVATSKSSLTEMLDAAPQATR
jgi:membrane fusion protein (multidrug efflux system)